MPAPTCCSSGLEFGVYFTADGGQRWTQLKGGIPVIQARDLHIQRRENDLVVGTFGRGAYILDDYSPLRGLTAETASADAVLLPLRDAYLFDELGQQRAAWGNQTTPNPPYGAVFTYQLNKPPAGETRMVLSRSRTTTAGRCAGSICRPRPAFSGLPGTCAPIPRPRLKVRVPRLGAAADAAAWRTRRGAWGPRRSASRVRRRTGSLPRDAWHDGRRHRDANRSATGLHGGAAAAVRSVGARSVGHRASGNGVQAGSRKGLIGPLRSSITAFRVPIPARPSCSSHRPAGR